MRLKIPRSSILNYWVKALSLTEVPLTYQVACGLSCIGALLKREVWIDQQAWKVYPNQSVMLVGPSGIGKDTAIDFATRVIEKFDTVPVLGGRTIEAVQQRLFNIGNPACAYIPAGELTSFFGNKDYQSGMVQDFTDLLSTKDKKDISTKGDLTFSGPKIILCPTLTLHCGTTEEWLHKAMPDGTLEGGFLGRFLIMTEQFGRRQVPLIKDEIESKEEREEIDNVTQKWYDGVSLILQKCQGLGEFTLFEEAKYKYANWYHNRFKRFSKAVLPYANRSRDTILRLAMLMALTKQQWGWIEEEDIQFGIDVLDLVAERIDEVVLPPTPQAQAAKAITALFPCKEQMIYKTLGRRFTMKQLQEALELLVAQGSVVKDKGVWTKNA